MVQEVMRRQGDYEERRIIVSEMQGRRGRGKPKRRLYSLRTDLTEKGLSGEEVNDRTASRLISSYNDLT